MVQIGRRSRTCRGSKSLKLPLFEWTQGVEKDFKEAIRWYRLAADQGNAVAQNNLDICYKNGEGVEKDLKEATGWFRLAANKGYASAQYNLGSRYFNGQGVEKNFKEAVKWFKLAADQGHVEAQKAYYNYEKREVLSIILCILPL